MIKTFRDSETEKVWKEERSRLLPPVIQKTALRKLQMLNAAATLNDLTAPPGNRLERLRGDRKGQYSIRINDQWRICFRWESDGVYDVQIVDYH